MCKYLNSVIRLLKVGFIGSVFMSLCGQSLADVKFEDSFESGDTGFTMNGYKWKGGPASGVSNDIARTGKYSLKFTFEGKPSGKDAWSEKRIEFGENLSNLYIEFYIYFPDGSDGLGPKYHHRNDDGPDNNKLLRVWDEDYSDFKVKYGFSMQPSSGGSQIFGEYAKNGGATGRYGEYYNKSAGIGSSELGKWVRINIRISVDKGNEAVMQLYRDGITVVDSKFSNQPNNSANNFLRNAYFLGWANSGFNDTTHIYIDDVRVSNQPFSGTIVAPPKSAVLE